MMLRTIAISVLLFVLGAVRLQAWRPIGHMAVAYLAYEQLTPTARARANALLKLDPAYSDWEKQLPTGESAKDRDRLIFMIAANWADDLKGDPKYSDDGTNPNVPSAPTAAQNRGDSDMLRHRYWHFIDTPFSPDHAAFPPIPAPNAETQIDVFRTVPHGGEPDGSIRSHARLSRAVVSVCKTPNPGSRPNAAAASRASASRSE